MISLDEADVGSERMACDQHLLVTLDSVDVALIERAASLSGAHFSRIRQRGRKRPQPQ